MTCHGSHLSQITTCKTLLTQTVLVCPTKKQVSFLTTSKKYAKIVPVRPVKGWRRKKEWLLPRLCVTCKRKKGTKRKTKAPEKKKKQKKQKTTVMEIAKQKGFPSLHESELKPFSSDFSQKKLWKL